MGDLLLEILGDDYAAAVEAAAAAGAAAGGAAGGGGSPGGSFTAAAEAADAGAAGAWAAPSGPAGGGSGAWAAPLSSLLSSLATAGVSAYQTHEQADAVKRQLRAQQTGQQTDKVLRDYALEMRKKSNEARAKADAYRQTTAGKGLTFGTAYRSMDETARALDKAAIEAEARAGLRPPVPGMDMDAAKGGHAPSWFKQHQAALVGSGAALVVIGGLVLLLRKGK